MTYMLSLWGADCHRISILQKAAVRLIHNAPYRAHTDPIFKALNLLKIDDLYRISLAKLYYNLSNRKCPMFIINNIKLIRHSDLHDYNTRQKSTYELPLIKKQYLSQSLNYRLMTVMNHIPISIRDKVLTHSFLHYVACLKTLFIANIPVSTCTGCYACRQ